MLLTLSGDYYVRPLAGYGEQNYLPVSFVLLLLGKKPDRISVDLLPIPGAYYGVSTMMTVRGGQIVFTHNGKAYTLAKSFLFEALFTQDLFILTLEKVL